MGNFFGKTDEKADGSAFERRFGKDLCFAFRAVPVKQKKRKPFRTSGFE
jgi:hypothetical protein